MKEYAMLLHVFFWERSHNNNNNNNNNNNKLRVNVGYVSNMKKLLTT